MHFGTTRQARNAIVWSMHLPQYAIAQLKFKLSPFASLPTVCDHEAHASEFDADHVISVAEDFGLGIIASGATISTHLCMLDYTSWLREL